MLEMFLAFYDQIMTKSKSGMNKAQEAKKIQKSKVATTL